MYGVMVFSTKIRIEKIRDKAPPSWLGIDQRIAYANRKYHSGVIWGGILKGWYIEGIFQGLLTSQVKTGLNIINIETSNKAPKYI